jgi:hypothetical protein
MSGLRRKVFLYEEGDVRSLEGGTVALAARFNLAGVMSREIWFSTYPTRRQSSFPADRVQSVFPDVDQRFDATGI